MSADRNTDTSARVTKLRQVLQLLTSSCKSLIVEWEASTQGQKESANGRSADNTDLPSHAAFEAERTIKASLGSIEELTCSPTLKLMEFAMSFWAARALHIVAERRVPALLAAAGNAGLDIKDIAREVGIEEGKLARMMQTLASEHIFCQVGQTRFTNNRISQALVNNEPFWAWIVYCGLINYTASDHLPTTLRDPNAGPSYNLAHTAFSRAAGENSNVYEWLKKASCSPAATRRYEPPTTNPGFFNHSDGQHLPQSAAACNGQPQEKSQQTYSFSDEALFNLAMIGEGKVASDAHVHDFPWEGLGSATLVDVGGGAGGFPMQLCPIYPELKFIVQDRTPMIEKAEEVWRSKSLNELTSGRTQLMVHDFFQDNPVKGAEVYWLRSIIHNWNDENAIRILSSVAKAMAPHSRLLIADHVMYPTARSEDGGGNAAPEPLLANYGHAMAHSYQRDLCMMAIWNAVERTPAQFKAIVEDAGLQVVKIWNCRSLQSIIECRLPKLLTCTQ